LSQSAPLAAMGACPCTARDPQAEAGQEAQKQRRPNLPDLETNEDEPKPVATAGTETVGAGEKAERAVEERAVAEKSAAKEAALGDFRILPDSAFSAIYCKFGRADVKQPVLTPTSAQAVAAVVAEVVDAAEKVVVENADAQLQAKASPDANEEAPLSMCMTCGKYDCKLLKCSRCNSVCFCSVECQKVAWKTHKSDCARLAADLKLKRGEKASDSNVDSLTKDMSQIGEAPVSGEGGTMSSDPTVAKH